MCRRDLPSSAAALPAHLVLLSRSGNSFLPELPRSGGRQSERRRTGSPNTSKGIDFRGLPGRLSQQVRSLTAREALAANQFKELWACVEALGAVRKSDKSTQLENVLHVRQLLSQILAKTFAEMPMDDLMSVIPECSKALESEDLLVPVILDALRTGVMRSMRDCGKLGNDNLPDAAHVRWHEVRAFTEHLLALRKHDVFAVLVAGFSPYAARQVFDIVKLSSLDQLPDTLRCAKQLLEPWSDAMFQFTAALKTWLPTRLQQLLARLPGTSEAAFPLLPPVSSHAPPTRKGGKAAWMRSLWWLDMLRTATVAGVLENSQLVELCMALAPRFLEDGIKTASAQAVLVATGLEQSMQGMGDPFSPRLFANELSRRPAMVRFMPNLQIVLFNCPGDENSATESIILTSSFPASPPRSSRSHAAGAAGDSRVRASSSAAAYPRPH